jgi:hypothetical protein
MSRQQQTGCTEKSQVLYRQQSALTDRKPAYSPVKHRQTAVEIVAAMCHKRPLPHLQKKVSVYRAPHLLCCRALELQKYVCAPDALHLRHPVNAYNEVF